MSSRINSITLLGSSSGRNAGDAAIISGIMDSIDAACNKRLIYEIPTIKPSFIKRNYANRVKPISMLPWAGSLKMLGFPTYHSIMRSDLTMIFDAILFDRSLYNPLFNFLSTLYLMLPRAKKAGKMLGMFNCGCGPVNTPTGKRMLREIVDMMDFVTVRDKGSLEVLHDIGVTNPNILLTADAALNVVGAPDSRAIAILRELGVDHGEEILGININKYMDTWAVASDPTINGGKVMGREKFINTYAQALSSVAKELNVRLLFVCTQHHDIEITKDLMNRLDTGIRSSLISNRLFSHYELISVLGKLDLLFSMRLHASILATSGLTPTIGLAFQPKNLHYFETLGMTQYMMYFNDFSVDNLIAHILRGWADRPKMRKHLEKVIPSLRLEALKASELVASLNRGENVKAAIANLNQMHTLAEKNG